MHRVAISSTGLFTPPEVITNEELVLAFNQYAARENRKNADAIAAGTVAAVTDSSVEFIEKASGIKQRYVLNKSGVLDPERMHPRFAQRPDSELSPMAGLAGDDAAGVQRRHGHREASRQPADPIGHRGARGGVAVAGFVG